MVPVLFLPVRRGSIHRHNLPGGSLDIKLQPDITKQCTPLWCNRARSQCCSPHTSLMAICGHYGPPMSHTHSPEWSLCSSRACCCVFLDSEATAVFVLAYSDCCYWCLSSCSTPPPLPPPPTLTHQHACTHARCCLSAGKMSEITLHVYTDMQT